MHQAPGGKSVLKEVNAAGGIDTLRIYDPSDSPLSIGRMRSMFGDMREQFRVPGAHAHAV